MRTFIAIELEDELKNYIFEKQQILKSNSEKGNFSRKENFHLTLRFIGESSPTQIEALKKAIDTTSEKITSFGLKLGELGYFPKKNRKIIWLGIGEGKATLQQLFNELENNLYRDGFKREERGLSPHITLGRQVILKKGFDKIAEDINILYKDIPVKKISLMESTRINDILTYRPIYTKPLIS
ncbi:RNA 2',3'-cyclic phosphodiesterase [Wukongibacter baidiensis]|uniref:RNA 2',3'-cyclic phosphodiesterase n=1 Tax=Wukongibacter baidiensis TaxID=1723361 RepID=UPI003D7F88DD